MCVRLCGVIIGLSVMVRRRLWFSVLVFRSVIVLMCVSGRLFLRELGLRR